MVGFINISLMPIAFAYVFPIRSLNPLQMMIGIDGLIAIIPLAS